MIFLITSILSDVILDISFKIISDPKLKFCSDLSALFSRKKFLIYHHQFLSEKSIHISKFVTCICSFNKTFYKNSINL